MQTYEMQLQKARQLYQLNRKDQAIEELSKLLAIAPDTIDALYLIVACYIETNNSLKADEYWQKLAQVAPNIGLTHYYHAIILDRLERTKEAEEAIWEAIHFDPHDADFWAFLSAIYIDKKEWEKGLEYAEKGLEIEPENTLCLNHRTRCLTKLDRTSELNDSIDEALSSDPYNSYTHSNVGWSKLEQNLNEEAEEHFREALRINPMDEYAKEGMKESIKARNIIYRTFLNYAFWMAKQQSLVQWAVILGFYFAQRTLPSPFNIIVMIMVIGTWLITPISNFVLLFDKNGRYLLSKIERLGAMLVGSLVVISIIGLITGLALDIPDMTTVVGLFGVYASLPIAGLTSSQKNYDTWWIRLIGLGLPIFGLIAVIIMFGSLFSSTPYNELFEIFWDVFSIGSILSTWIFAFRMR